MAEKESDDVGGDNHSIASNEMKSKTHYYVSKQQSQWDATGKGMERAINFSM